MQESRSVQSGSIFQTNSLKDFYPLVAVIELFTKACGRFRSPLSWRDRAILHLVHITTRLSIFENIAALPSYKILPNWQVLLNYLHFQGIIEKPEFSTWSQPNDAPQQHKFALAANPHLKGYGFSNTSAEEAYAKSVGELLERYFLSYEIKELFMKASYASIKRRGIRVIELDQLPSYLPWQKELFPEYSYDDNSIFDWVRVKELLSGTYVYVPAQLIFLRGRSKEEPILRQQTSSGAGGHYTFEEAALSAIQENVERDMFMMYWLNTISPPVIDLTSIADSRVSTFINTLVKRYGFSAHLLDTTGDLAIPSCVFVLIDSRGNEPRLSIGSKAGFDIATNILAAANEALSTQTAPGLSSVTLPNGYKPFSDSKFGKDERLNVWIGHSMLEKAKFFISGPEVTLSESAMGRAAQSFPSKQAEYSHTLSLFKKKGKGYELYCYEAKHPVLRTLGYHVTKVLVPRLFPLYINESFATLDSERLQSMPTSLGYSDVSLNPWPHPFP